MGGDYGLGTICAHLLVPSIMQQDYAAAANLFCDFPLDCRGWRGVPVVARDVPHDGFEAELAGHAEDSRAASSEGRAEEIGGFADGVLQGRAALAEFATDFSFALESQQGMGEGVVADDVAGVDNLADHLRMLQYIASDQEKGCADVMLREDFEQAWCVRVVRSVVVGQSDLS